VKRFHYLLEILLVTILISCGQKNSTELIDERLTRFYAEGSGGSVMNEPIPKFSVQTGKQITPNSFLKLKAGGENLSPLSRMAQAKGTEQFRVHYCEEVLQKHFPGLNCSEGNAYSWGAIESNDRIEDLVKGWVDHVETELDAIPVEGKVKMTLWSDDYWQIRYGATSYRYAANGSFMDYKSAVGSYAQPGEWLDLLSKLMVPALAKNVLAWSPSEKYDLIVGDESFSLTNEQKQEGLRVAGPEGDVESWMGICHGWAAASIMVPAPLKPVTTVGAQGVEVHWYPHDIRALASLAWANGRSGNNYVGGRCNTKEPELYPNDRVKQPDCFDNNPATFHLALGNQIGRAKASLVMDTAFDYEVWNQPLQSYQFTYFNPLSPQKRSKNWKEVTIPYDDAFKAKDRFQNPLTRGKTVDAVVGVLAQVVYIAEVTPSHSDQAQAPRLVSATYEYDLELTNRDGRLTPTGGEWHTNFHPDFLWVPKKDTVAFHPKDAEATQFSGKVVPDKRLTKTATRASRDGYPLCSVLSTLVNESAKGEFKYSCN
jgi:hypothetical protein